LSGEGAASAPRFRERPTEPLVRDAYWFGGVPAAAGLLLGLVGLVPLAVLAFGLAGFVAWFFRNPVRRGPDDAASVLAPADGRVLAVDTLEDPELGKVLRIGIFLSVFDVHVNRCPVEGRVVAVERGGSRYLAAFDRRAGAENARVALELETARGERVFVVQIAGLVARRIVCHPQVGEWVARGARYGMIRFGSRTDVVLPAEAELCVRRGERVRGGASAVARLPGRA
jgi:phosphatidylserine decarboxylase